MDDIHQDDPSALDQSITSQFKDGSRFAYASIGPELMIEQVGPNFARMIGRPGEALAGRTLSEPLREFIGLENVLRDILEGKRSRFRLEQISRVQNDGAIISLTFQVAPLEASRPDQGLLLLVEDSTDNCLLQEAYLKDNNELSLVREKLVEVNEELARVNRMRSFLMSKAAHDLKGPLTTIQGFASILKEDINNHEQLEFLDIIIGQSDRMRRLIDNLLAFEQIEQGHLVLDWQNCNLNEVVDKVVNASRPSAEMRKHSLIFNRPDRQFVIWADSNRLTQVVYNLLENAIKYTPEGGQVDISLRQGNSNIEIEVADTGLGMSDDQIDHLFGRHKRTNEIRGSNFKGSGLGFIIAQSLVETHGGTLTVESEVGQGTVMKVFLPNGKADTT